MARGFEADFAIAGEPTDCHIVCTHKGALWFKLIRPLQKRTRLDASKRRKHDQKNDRSRAVPARRLPRFTASVERFRIGRFDHNPRCDPRWGADQHRPPLLRDRSRSTHPAGEDHASILAELEDTPGVETRVIRDCRPFSTDPRNPFVQRFASAIGSGADTQVGAPWFCDAVLFAARGVPAVAFGPGSVAQAHTADEFIDLNQILRAKQILERFLSACASG